MLNGSPAAQLTDVDPRRLGTWDVQARIGSGGMGVVYRAVRGEEVAAVKVVRPGLLDDPQVAARFEREAQVLRSVQDTHQPFPRRRHRRHPGVAGHGVHPWSQPARRRVHLGLAHS